MMEKEKLRGADLITGAILVLFAGWMLSETFKMPMTDTFGGVENVWYVSPALFPLFIGVVILLIGIALIINAVRHGGIEIIKTFLKTKRSGISDGSFRFISILLGLGSFVYLTIPRVDFFLDIVLFLIFMVPLFYIDDAALIRKYTVVYAIGMAVLLLVFITPIAAMLNGFLVYSTDIITLVFILVFGISFYFSIRGNVDYERKFRSAMLVVLITPILVVPAFRFLLKVPLPFEGGIVDLLFLVYYMFK